MAPPVERPLAEAVPYSGPLLTGVANDLVIPSLEQDWWAIPGSYSYEPPGDIHTLEVPEGVEKMVTLFHVTGSYTYVEPDGTPVGVEDVFTQLETAKAHYESVGIGADYVMLLVR
ncbi:hypothetical protein N7493_004863 [Penicillium malachiteum]|uniref:ChrR-like cupin domain-containing protein n=1 Tax=Penicillium malachiteum TaxID=1324776 RepID=A0AAD6MXF5_9EURO|nr:hypothetical protein N7493_004863 [Penicillium malachiteum]